MSGEEVEEVKNEEETKITNEVTNEEEPEKATNEVIEAERTKQTEQTEKN